MKHITYFLFFIFIINFNNSFAEDKKGLSLQDSIKYTYENNNELKAVREDLKATKTYKTQAIGEGFLPTVSLESQRGDSSSTSNLSTGGKQRIERDIDKDQVVLSQPIFRGGRTLTQLKTENSRIKIKQYELLEKEQSLILQTINAYIDVLQTQTIYKIAKENKQALKKSYDYSLIRKQYKKANLSEVSFAEARYSLARKELIEAKKNFILSESNFEKIIGLKPYLLKDNLNILFRKIRGKKFTEEEVYNKSLSQNINYLSYKETYQFNRNNLRNAKTEFAPSVYLKAVSSKGREYNTTESRMLNTNENSVSLNLSIPLMSSGSNYFNHKRASHLVNKSKFDLFNAKKSLKNESIKVYEELVASKSFVHFMQIYVKSTKTSLYAMEQEEKYGQKTIIDVLDRRKEYFAAKINLINAKVDSTKAYYNLKFFIGELKVN